jgi:phosphoribosylamine--glycine ligase
MLTSEGMKVLEYNVRFGDPEIQAILPLMKTDLVPILDDAVEGRLSTTRCEWTSGSCATIVLASGGYPGDFQIGKEIQGLDAIKNRADLQVFHAGTKKDRQRIITWGGRALNVTGTGPDLEAALKRAYDAIGGISFEGMTFRKDIGHRALKKHAAK